MWRKLRIAILLLVLFWAAASTWLDRYGSTRWRDPLWVGIFPISADPTASAREYVDTLAPASFADIEKFFTREAFRYGQRVAVPVHIELYPPVYDLPPALERNPGIISSAWWSLKLRWYAWRAARFGSHAPPRIRLFVLFHDPQTLPAVPDSHGLQKGLVAVVHVFAQRSMAATNDLVIAHELLHTLGATDKYDPRTGAPRFPSGYGDPQRQPLYPQSQAEIMAGRLAISPQESAMPASLADVVVGPQTAQEIRWTHR